MPAGSLSFGHFELDAERRRLLRDGRSEELGGRAFDLLLALAERRDRVVSKSELMDLVWPGLVVEENNLAVQVRSLRRVLGNDAIATVPGRGYRFTAGAELAAASNDPGPAAPIAECRELRTNLPAVLPELIGRDETLAALQALVHGHRLVTITGPGGTGKTLLAQHLLRSLQGQHRHGACLVDLSPLRHATQLPGAVASASGLRAAGGDAQAALAGALAPLGLLMVLDNCEHLLDAVAELASALLAASPGLRILATSQAPLKAQGEQVFRLAGLTVPADVPPLAQALDHGAVALFVQRAQAADRRFTLRELDVASVCAICRRLDGSALAIELAAARVPLLGLAGVERALDERLGLLASGRRDAPPRQQSLRAALAWSHGLLDEAEQTVFRRLSVFAAAAELALIERVVGDDRLDRWAVIDALAALVDRALVAVVTVVEDAEFRYRLLESPRALALEKLAAAGEVQVLRERHARAYGERWSSWLLEDFQRHEPLAARMTAMARETDDARAAFDWTRQHDPGLTLGLGALLLSALEGSGPERMEVADVLEAEVTDEGARPLLRAHALAQLSWSYRIGPRRARRRDCAERAVMLCRQVADPAELYFALGRLANAATAERDLVAAEAALAELSALEDPGWVPHLRALGAESEKVWASASGDRARAVAAARRQVALEEAGGRPQRVGLNNLVDAELAAGEVQAAMAHAQQLVALLVGTRFEYELALARLNLMAAAVRSHNLPLARQAAAEGWPQAARFVMLAWWADHLALLAAREGCLQQAAQLCGYADAIYAATQDRREVNEAHSLADAWALAVAGLGQAQAQALREQGMKLTAQQVDLLVGAQRRGRMNAQAQ